MVSLSSIEILTNTSQIATRPESADVDDENREEVSIVNAMGNGDTVEISEAARESYAAVQETTVAGEVENDTESVSEVARAGGGTVPASGDASGAAAGGTATSSTTETDSSETDVEELEEEIASLREEIASLMAEQSGDESNQAELNAKQAELSGLLAELALRQAE